MKLTLSTMYNYVPDLFDNLKLPDGLDKDTFVQNLIMDSGEFGCLYADGDYFKSIIGWWCSKELPIWEKLYNTELLKYDPIANYDRTDEITREVTGNSTASETSYNSEALHVTNGSDSAGNEVTKSRSFGNVGVTSSQQLIEAERRVSEFNTYAYIIRSFTNKFCIELY